MNDFYLEKISVTYNEDEQSSDITFEKGLNILHGPSNCGKSEAINSIYSISSDSPNKIISENSITLKEKTYNMALNISRNSKPHLANIMEEHFGFPKNTKILNSKDGSSKELTFNSILPLLILDESRMLSLNNKSIFNEKSYFTKALVYYIYENDDLHEILEKHEKNKTIEEIDNEIKFLNRRSELIQEDIDCLGGTDELPLFDTNITTINEINLQIKKQASLIDDLLNRKSLLLQERFTKCEKINQLNLLVHNQQSLLNQYEADIRRLEFIAQGQNILEPTSKESSQCPICGSVIHANHSSVNSESLNRELTNLMDKTTLLHKDQKAFKIEIINLDDSVNEITDEIEEIEEKINNQATPLLDYLRCSKDSLILSLQNKGRILELKNQLSKINKNLTQLNHQKEEYKNQNAKLEFKSSDNFIYDLNLAIKNILEYSEFPYWYDASFDEDKFEIYIKKMPKIGSGWITYLKTVLFIALRIILRSKNNFSLPFMIIDTPFMGLSNEPDSQEMKMKTGLIRYLYNHQEELGQVILVEKTEQLPDLDIFPNINEMHFGTDSKALRKGFRIDIKPIKDELF